MPAVFASVQRQLKSELEHFGIEGNVSQKSYVHSFLDTRIEIGWVRCVPASRRLLDG